MSSARQEYGFGSQTQGRVAAWGQTLREERRRDRGRRESREKREGRDRGRGRGAEERVVGTERAS